jgi:thiol-disulfide isomerase/thioredoxin
MRTKFLCTFLTATLLLAATAGLKAQDSSAATDLKALVSKIEKLLEAEKDTAGELAGPLKEFEALRAKYKNEKSDEVADIYFMEAMLYMQVLDDDAKATEILTQMRKNLPDTRRAKDAERIIDSINQQAEAKKVQAALVKGAKFPDFDEKDMEGKPLSISKFKGKVVLIDFWATWCGPCVRELPHVLNAYEKHHANGFDIIGISLDKEEKAVAEFVKKHEMPWPQYFDGKGWQNKLAAKYGISSIPATYLLDGEGKIIDRDLRGDALEQAVAMALAAK